MEDRVLQAALAGLLHDVGKLEQRAADDPRFPPPGTTREGQPVHAAFTQAFVDGLPERYRWLREPEFIITIHKHLRRKINT